MAIVNTPPRIASAPSAPVVPVVSAAPAASAQPAARVIDPVEPQAPTGNVLIARMGVRADLSDEAAMPRGAARKQAVYDDLVATAKSSQVAALEKLAQLQTIGEVSSFESMFLPNAILITAAPGKASSVTQALQGVANVEALQENKTWSIATDGVLTPTSDALAGATHLTRQSRATPSWNRIPRGESESAQDSPPPQTLVAPEAPQIAWGVAKIGAPAAWDAGIDGRGVTIGIVDTGLDTDHPAIKAHYRGTNADGTQSNDYNWYDGFGTSAKPFDDGEHGTHVAGSAAGGSNERAIGVAPGAKIIAAKAINGRGYNTTDATLKSLQWMMAPTKVDGTVADPTKAPDVINNSWGNADQSDRTFLETFEALKAAGIEVVSAAGNDGPRPGTISTPGSFPGFISVAATNQSDGVTSFSSRGPSKFAKPEDMVPNLAAPGGGITSSVPGGGYQSMSGTSMASPHVAGAVALLLQAKPNATHDEIVKALEQTAIDIDTPGPDTSAGYGRIDVVAALGKLGTKIATAVPAPPPSSTPAAPEATAPQSQVWQESRRSGEAVAEAAS
jgi:subtilisin family serine protease